MKRKVTTIESEDPNLDDIDIAEMLRTTRVAIYKQLKALQEKAASGKIDIQEANQLVDLAHAIMRMQTLKIEKPNPHAKDIESMSDDELLAEVRKSLNA